MQREIKVLLVDDHPIITSAYEAALDKYSEKENCKFDKTTVHDLDSALELIEEEGFVNDLGMVFLDMRLPPSKEGKLISGQDLGLELKNKKPELKIVVSTTFNDNYRLNNIIQSLNPDGLLVKNDITPGELITAIDNILEGTPYYSKTILNLLRKQITSDIQLDEIDRRLLYQLSIGTKLKDLPNVLPLSTGGLEKRRRNLKKIFDISGEEDRELIRIAKEKGFI